MPQTIDLNGNGISSEEDFGNPVLTQSVIVSGISSSEAFGNASISYSQVIEPTGILSSETFGRLVVQAGLTAINLSGQGIPSQEAFGKPLVASAILCTGIPSEEHFGAPFIEGIPANWSLKYLPPYNQAQDLYKLLICPVLDFIMLQDFVAFKPSDDQDILNQAHKLLVSGDDEALLAYFRTMIKPIVGTLQVIKLVISFSGYGDSTIIEWYDYGNESGKSFMNPVCNGNIFTKLGYFNPGQPFYFKVIAGAIAGSSFPGIIADPPDRSQSLITNLDAEYNALSIFIIQYKNQLSTLESLKLSVSYYIGGPFIGNVTLAGEKIEIYDKSISGQTALDERGSIWKVPSTFPCGS